MKTHNFKEGETLDRLIDFLNPYIKSNDNHEVIFKQDIRITAEKNKR